MSKHVPVLTVSVHPMPVGTGYYAKCNLCGATDGPVYKRKGNAQKWRCPSCAKWLADHPEVTGANE